MIRGWAVIMFGSMNIINLVNLRSSRGSLYDMTPHEQATQS